MKVAVARRPPLSTHTHTPTHTPTLGCILRMRAYVRPHTHALLRTHLRTHTYPVVHVWCARAHDPPDPASAHRRGRVSAAAAGTHRILRLGQSAAAGSAASSVSYAYLRAHRAAAPGGAGPPRPRAGRPRAPAVRARRSADGRRPATPPPPHPTPRGSAPAPGAAAPRAARSAGTAAIAHGGGRRARDAQLHQELALAERLGERRHLRGVDGPAVHRARVRPAPAAHRWADVGPNGPKPWKVTAQALNTHPHARDRHTGAFGAATVP